MAHIAQVCVIVCSLDPWNSLHQENEEAVVKGGKEFLLKYFEVYTVYEDISRYIKIYQDISRHIKYIKHSWALKVPIGQLGDVCFIGSLGVFPGLSVNTFGTGCMWTVCSVCLCIVCLCGAQLCAYRGHFAVAKSTPNANATRYARNLLNKKTPARQAIPWLWISSRYFQGDVDGGGYQLTSQARRPSVTALLLSRVGPRRTQFFAKKNIIRTRLCRY